MDYGEVMSVCWEPALLGQYSDWAMGWMNRDLLLAWAGNFSLHRHVHTSSGACPGDLSQG